MNDPRELPEWLQREADVDRSDRALKRLAIAVLGIWLAAAIAVGMFAWSATYPYLAPAEESHP